MARAERKIAHLALDPSGVAPIAAGHDAFVKYLVENGVMKCSPLQRGK